MSLPRLDGGGAGAAHMSGAEKARGPPLAFPLPCAGPGLAQWAGGGDTRGGKIARSTLNFSHPPAHVAGLHRAAVRIRMCIDCWCVAGCLRSSAGLRTDSEAHSPPCPPTDRMVTVLWQEKSRARVYTRARDICARTHTCARTRARVRRKGAGIDSGHGCSHVRGGAR